MFREIVQNSIINNSTSKQMYSFGQSSRFPKEKKILNEKFYTLPDLKEKRSAGIGYGNKLDFNGSKKNKEFPAPDKYQIKSDFSCDKNKGISIGTSREKMKINSILGNINKNPGPGNYNYNYSTLSDIKYSFTSGVRNDENRLKNKELELIGPGKYKVEEGISKNGKYVISKFKTYGIPVMNPLSVKSVSPDNHGPGPASYDPKVSYLNDVRSKFKSQRGITFTSAKRIETNTQKLQKKVPGPGPGSYRLNTDFGHYDSQFTHYQSESKIQKTVPM